MGDLKFSCVHCKGFVPWAAERVGVVAECPACGSEFVVPDQAERVAEPIGIMESTIDQAPRYGTQSLAGLIRRRSLNAGVALDSGLIDGLESSSDEKYHIGERIATGGMGAILDVRDINLRRHIAMKVMLHPKQASDHRLARFIEEAQVTGQLEHPGIVPVHELGVDAEHRPFYTMKLLKGRTLQKILEAIRTRDPETIEAWPLSKLLTVFAKVCDAMRYAHSKGVIHRDLKPDNIMVGEFGEVQVLDWGLAKILKRSDHATDSEATTTVQSIRSSEESDDRWRSMDGTIAGTPNYMAPEQAAGKTAELDNRTDVYALGTILYQMLTLHMPVTGESVHDVLFNVQASKIVPPAEQPGPFPHCPSEKIPGALAAIAMKALARKPAARFQGVGALLADIEHYQHGFATEAEEAGVLRQLVLFLKRNRTFAIAAALVTTAVLAGTVVSFVQWRNALASQKTAEGALEKKEMAERDKQRNVRASAPAFLNAANALSVHEQDFPSALVNARQARENNPDLTQAWLLEIFLRVEADERDTALNLAEQLAVRTKGEHPSFATLKKLRQWHDGDETALGSIAPAARAIDQHRLAAIFSQRAGMVYQDHYQEMLPVWRRQLDQAFPQLGEGLSISSRGLSLTVTNPPFKDLEFLRGLPLNSLTLRGWKTKLDLPADLYPLADTTLRHFETSFPVDTLAPITSPALVELVFRSESSLADPSAFEALRDNQFEVFRHPAGFHPRQFNGFHIQHLQTSIDDPLPNPATGWAQEIRGLETLELRFSPLGGAPNADISPLLALPNLREIISARGIHLGPTLADGHDVKNLADWVQRKHSSIKSTASWAKWTRHNLELMQYCLARSEGDSPALPAHPLVQTVGDRTFTVVDAALTTPAFMDRTGMSFASIHSDAEQAAAFGFLDHVVMPGYRPRVLLAAHKTAQGWAWLDGTPWDFQRLSHAERESHTLVLDAEGWRPFQDMPQPHFHFFADRWLVSWPASGPMTPTETTVTIFQGKAYAIPKAGAESCAEAAKVAATLGARLASVDSEEHWDFLVQFCLRNLERTTPFPSDHRQPRNVFLISPDTPVSSLPPGTWREAGRSEPAPSVGEDGLVIKNKTGRFELAGYHGTDGIAQRCILVWDDPDKVPDLGLR